MQNRPAAVWNILTLNVAMRSPTTFCGNAEDDKPKLCQICGSQAFKSVLLDAVHNHEVSPFKFTYNFKGYTEGTGP